MHLDGEYALPAGPVEVEPAVRAALDKALSGLKRITVIREEDGKRESIGGFLVDGKKDEYPDDNVEQILDTAYRLAFMKSKELEREVHVRFEFHSYSRKNPFTVTATVIDPETHTGNEQGNAAVIAQLASTDPNTAVAAIATQQTHFALKMTERAMQVLVSTNSDLREDVRAGANREASLAHALIDGEIQSRDRDNAREDRVYQVLDHAMEKTIESGNLMADLRHKELTMDLNIEREKLRADGTKAFISEIGGQLSQALPILMMAGMAKMTDADPSMLAAMMGGGMPGMPGAPPVQTGPPPPPPPKSRTVAPGARTASAPVPRPTTVPTPTQVPTAAPGPLTLQPGQGVAHLSLAVGVSITPPQWAQFSNILSPDHLQRLREWWAPQLQTDQEAIGAMMRCVQLEAIASAISNVVTESQGMILDQLLTQVYSSMGVARPVSSESVTAPPASAPQSVPTPPVSDPPSLRVVEASAQDSKPNNAQDSKSNNAAEDSKSNTDDADAESDTDGAAETEDSQSNKTSSDSKTTPTRAKKASKSRSKKGPARKRTPRK